jgi:hypothetical protein
MADPRVRFLDLVPSVHSRIRGWTVRSVRSKEIHEVKALNVRFVFRDNLLMIRIGGWEVRLASRSTCNSCTMHLLPVS